jgi:hypothetical protein
MDLRHRAVRPVAGVVQTGVFFIVIVLMMAVMPAISS